MNIKKHIPNSITCCNLISGAIATSAAFQFQPKAALTWIIIGAIFDFFDGFTARLLHVSSPIGKELDSLADCITFGLAPSAILFATLSTMEFPSPLASIAPYLPYTAFLMAGFSGLRLAKFNLDERQTLGFIGLPTPANALFWGALILQLPYGFDAYTYTAPLLIMLMLVCSFLLVSELPMFALKFKHWGWRGNEIKYLFVITCIPLLLLFQLRAFALIIAWYVILSIVSNWSKNKKA